MLFLANHLLWRRGGGKKFSKLVICGRKKIKSQHIKTYQKKKGFNHHSETGVILEIYPHWLLSSFKYQYYTVTAAAGVTRNTSSHQLVALTPTSYAH